MQQNLHTHTTFEKHTPVMLPQVIRALAPAQGKRYIDTTVGYGGHTRELLRAGASVLGIDQDKEALSYTTMLLEKEFPDLEMGTDWICTHGNFEDIVRIAQEHRFIGIDGILFDLGMSSAQLDSHDRGFSYRDSESDIDLRMDTNQGMPAWQFIRQASEPLLYETIASFGEEQLAGPIAHALYRACRINEVRTCGEVVQIIRSVGKNERMLPKVLARVFQAFRIAVNRELEVLPKGLEGAEYILAAGGMLAVLTYHSLEDRIVKQFIRNHAFRKDVRKPIRPSREEVLSNSRARSAKLRTAIRL